MDTIFQEGLVDIDQLIDEAIPKAVSLTGNSKRVERQLEILLSADGRLKETIKMHLQQKIREAQPTKYEPTKWLVKAAIGSEYLQEGNTFAKSIWLHLVDEVAISLAPIIELLDHGSGLEHIFSHNPNSWQHSLYIFFSQNEEILAEKYGKSASETTTTFPFSWVIINLLDRLQQQENLFDVVSPNPFVMAVNEITQDNEHAIYCFATDLLAEKVPKLKSHLDLMQTVTKRIVLEAEYCQQFRTNNDHRLASRFLSVVDVYKAVMNLVKRLKVLAEIVEIDSSIIGQLKACQDAFDFDNQAIVCLLDKAKPAPEQYEKWQEKIKKIGSIVAAMGSHLSSLAQDKWLKVNMIEMFLEHVYWPKRNDENVKTAVFEKVKLLWALKDIEFVKSGKSFDSILKTIEKTSNSTAEKMLEVKNADHCFMCRETFKDPVRLPCGHVACLECLEEHYDGKEITNCPRHQNCPVFEDGYKLETTKIALNKLQPHRQFRKGLNAFFLSVLTSQVFKVSRKLC